MQEKIINVMKHNPLTIGANSLVVEALDIMNKHMITCLFVADENHHLKGIIHLHDCLKVGATPQLT